MSTEWIAGPDGCGYEVTIGEAELGINGRLLPLTGLDDGFLPFLRQWVAVPQRLTRAQYEAACLQFGVPCRADGEIDEYGAEYGEYDWLTYFATASKRVLGVDLALKQRRWRCYRRERPAPPPAPPIASQTLRKTGQLWEECPRCGREPVYMPLHLCDRCWPGGGR